MSILIKNIVWICYGSTMNMSITAFLTYFAWIEVFMSLLNPFRNFVSVVITTYLQASLVINWFMLNSNVSTTSLLTHVTCQILFARHNCTPAEDERSTPCPPSKYRSASGECNNVRHRPWGRRGDVFTRLLPPNYADGKPNMLTVR